MSRKFLVVGGGGREHAIAEALVRTSAASIEVFCAPGNAGTEKIATNVPIKADQIGGLVNFARQKAIDLTIVGPEAPLCAGLVDALKHAGLEAIGPTKAAAQLEGSKIFAKQFMRRHNIPTADFRHVRSLVSLERLLENSDFPLVIKADGLAAGKGVVICKSAEEAMAVGKDFIEDRRFGAASEQILVEQFVDGVETSVFCLTDGATIVVLPTARDYKRIYDGDQGPNTGGMGAISPSDVLSDEDLAFIERKILVPVIHGMKVEGTPYTGILYVGLMLTKTGPRVLEFNVRLGDPETQAILRRLKSDLGALLLSAVEGRLDEAELDWDERAAVTVVMASEGYPETPQIGRVITGVDGRPREDAAVHHAGTRRSAGKLLTSGGRVLALTALGKDLAAARARAYELLPEIRFDGAQHRSDIGL